MIMNVNEIITKSVLRIMSYFVISIVSPDGLAAFYVPRHLLVQWCSWWYSYRGLELKWYFNIIVKYCIHFLMRKNSKLKHHIILICSKVNLNPDQAPTKNSSMRLVLSADWLWIYLLRLLSPRFGPGSASEAAQWPESQIWPRISFFCDSEWRYLLILLSPRFGPGSAYEAAQSQVWPRISFFCDSEWRYLLRLLSHRFGPGSASEAASSQVWPRINFFSDSQWRYWLRLFRPSLTQDEIHHVLYRCAQAVINTI